MPLDVLIVGGGIGGAVLANLLGSVGRQCLVLEKNAQPPTLVRPEVLWPATVETLATLLPPGAMQHTAALPLHGVTMFLDGEPTLEANEAVLARAGVRPYCTNPNVTRELLLETGKFELRRGVEVTRVLREDGRVVGVGAIDAATASIEEFRAELTVGDDGVHSLVRQACGIPLRAKLFPLEFLCFPFDWPPEVPYAVVRVSLARSPNGLLGGFAAFPLPRLRGVGLIPVRTGATLQPERLKEDWDNLRQRDPAVGNIVGALRVPEDCALVRRPWGHARRYGAPGAALLGDAVHPVSPAGGQGANMSVADAVALADAILTDPSDPGPHYERRRRPANARSMTFTRLAALGLSLPGPVRGALFPRAVRWLGRRPDRFGRILRRASTAFLDDTMTETAPRPEPEPAPADVP